MGREVSSVESLVKNIFLVLSLLLFIVISPKAFSFDHAHVQWNMVLKANVKIVKGQSLVDYKAIKAAPLVLSNYLKSLEKLTKKEFDSFSSNQKLAFWINAYNAYTVKLIVSKYPVKSIKDTGSMFQSAWAKSFILLFDTMYSLDDIEHKIIRKDFKEPRIHFALNCASISCPNLITEPFVAIKLDSQLEKATKKFLLNTNKNKLKGDILLLSKIFDWYGEDFEKSHGSVSKFVGKYIKLPKKFELAYLPYDWKLNSSK
jgi:hypothetical protein